MERWVGRVAVVTGASGGIGACIAQELVKKGLKVVGLARRVEKIQELSATLKTAPGKLYAVKCDVTKEADVKETFRWVKSNLGGVDILVNNAGGDSSNNLIDGPAESWKSIFDINVLALSICTKEAIQSMRDRNVDDGHIVHINSTLGHVVPPAEFGFSMYTASKYAVTALTEGLRKELVNLKSNIRVTSISPGMVKTDFLTSSGTKLVTAEATYSSNPHLLPKDVADAVLFALGSRPHVQIHEVTIHPVGEKI
ncbi:dehydrogenase/reductase SDR family member 11-like [Zootermopsis nevadensis]|uniref:dehydrogenase/reductase SDR family member 11-like n=1 Tax=Zootermopsis nevadensis TaxID=136037 RepID=UPI000B8EBBFE|nr:dehydrogenase/reductase SDR family member 11-like [Zootermopsis nevadensis]XP_021929731.1 dehydrogenase/reductase SDR family member 11-like [Zootermopsis nevadensis]XP_021929732.1 dehydrogenase/reductase SDR family member 11-like [Zootermopsis nevadensis]XP_021929733.1 dehydrogenase/reductase SDR family member 11-like [Zootermopsis nevadensis]